MSAPALYSSEDQEHYTPADIAERARFVFGGRIDLDPASCRQANTIIKATRYFADQWLAPEQAQHQSNLDDPCFAGYNGLSRLWACTSLWLNPPFTVNKRDATGALIRNPKTNKVIRQRVIDEWVARWRECIDTRQAEQGMLLTPARTDTEWFSPLWGLPMCFISGRLRFGDASNSAPFPTVITYAGPFTDRFYAIFEPIGQCGYLSR